MERGHARVTNVVESTVGDELTAPVSAGATVLPVGDAGDFNETGGWLAVLDEDGAPTVLAYTAAFEDEDGDAGGSAITLAAGVATAAIETARVELWTGPAEAGGKPVLDYEAELVFDDQDGGDPIAAAIAPGLIDALPQGVRELVGESVVWERDDEGGEITVVQLVGEPLTRDGTYIDPATLPAVDNPSDGLPPAQSPTPTVRGGIGSIALTWPAVDNPDPVTVDIYGAAGTAPSTTGTPLASVASDGPGLQFVRDIDGAAVTPGVTYHFVLVARDADGAAAPSSTVTGTPTVITSDDVAADFVTANLLLANEALIEALRAQDITGVSLAIEGALTARPGFLDIVAEKATAKYLTLTDGMVTGTLDVFGKVRLLRGVSVPGVRPTLDIAYPATTQLATLPGASTRGLCDNPAGTEWVTLDAVNKKLERFSKATGSLVSGGSTALVRTGRPRGLTRIGSSYYVLQDQSSTNNSLALDVYDAATLARTATYGIAMTADYGADSSFALSPAPGGTVGIAYCEGSSSTATIERYTVTGDFVDIRYTYDMPEFALGLGAYYEGSADFGAAHVVLAHAGPTSDFRAYLPGSGSAGKTRVSGFDWYRREGTVTRGLWWDGTRFHSIGNAGLVQPYGTKIGLDAVEVRYAWLAESSGKETTPSPPSTLIQYARSHLSVVTPLPPQAGSTGADKANRVAIYAAKGTNPLRQQAALAVGANTYAITADPTTTGKAPEAANGFAATAAVGVAQSEGTSTLPAGGSTGPTIDLQGDGYGRVGPLRWNASGIADAPIVFAVTFAAGWSQYGSGFADCRGLYDPVTRRVTLEGLMIRSGAATASQVTTPLATIPAQFAPPNGGLFVPTVSSVPSIAAWRTDVTTAGAINAVRSPAVSFPNAAYVSLTGLSWVLA